jgi:hypothetical protein
VGSPEPTRMKLSNTFPARNGEFTAFTDRCRSTSLKNKRECRRNIQRDFLHHRANGRFLESLLAIDKPFNAKTHPKWP